MVGSGVHNARAWDELKEFAEGSNLPVEVTAYRERQLAGRASSFFG